MPGAFPRAGLVWARAGGMMSLDTTLARGVVAMLAASATLAAGVAHARASDPPPGIERSAPGLAWSVGLPYPPDQFGAVGPAHYVQGVTNTGIAVFRRADLSLAAGPVQAGTFAGAPTGAEVVDTQMMWDVQTSRWYY